MHKVTCVPRGHALGYVSIQTGLMSLKNASNKVPIQTSQLPENDRTSISYKEYLAGIDVAMGGRVAEELSAL